MKRYYCPHCSSKRPVVKAGVARGWAGYEKQRYVCNSCHRFTVKPREENR